MYPPKVWLDEDGIMCAEYPIHSSITLDDMQEMLRLRLALQPERHKLLVKLNGLLAFSASAQRFLAGAEHSAVTEALAVVVSPDEGYYQHTKILLRLFKNQQSLPYPLEFFDTKPEAVAWLHELG